MIDFSNVFLKGLNDYASRGGGRVERTEDAYVLFDENGNECYKHPSAEQVGAWIMFRLHVGISFSQQRQPRDPKKGRFQR